MLEIRLQIGHFFRPVTANLNMYKMLKKSNSTRNTSPLENTRGLPAKSPPFHFCPWVASDSEVGTENPSPPNIIRGQKVDLISRPWTVSKIEFEGTASNDFRGQIDVAASNGLKQGRITIFVIFGLGWPRRFILRSLGLLNRGQ